MVDAGKLRHQVQIKKYIGGTDALGDARQDLPENWKTVATVWAAVDPVSGREFYLNEQAETEITHKVTIRYRQGVTSKMRIALGARVLHIESVIDWQERHDHLLLMCKEIT